MKIFINKLDPFFRAVEIGEAILKGIRTVIGADIDAPILISANHTPITARELP